MFVKETITIHFPKVHWIFLSLFFFSPRFSWSYKGNLPLFSTEFVRRQFAVLLGHYFWALTFIVSNIPQVIYVLSIVQTWWIPGLSPLWFLASKNSMFSFTAGGRMPCNLTSDFFKIFTFKKNVFSQWDYEAVENRKLAVLLLLWK